MDATDLKQWAAQKTGEPDQIVGVEPDDYGDDDQVAPPVDCKVALGDKADQVQVLAEDTTEIDALRTDGNEDAATKVEEILGRLIEAANDLRAIADGLEGEETQEDGGEEGDAGTGDTTGEEY